MMISKFTHPLGLAALTLAIALPAFSQAAAPTADEAQAYKAIQDMVSNPATTSDQVDTAAKAYIAKFPSGVGLSGVETMTMQFYQHKGDYINELVWGEMALQKDPGNIIALSTLAAQIPGHWHDTDLDGDQRLVEASGYDQKLIDTFENNPPAADGSYTLSGHKISADQFKQMKPAYEGSAYSSEGRIAYDQKKYQDAVDAYKKALAIEPASQQGVDYFFMAQAQEGLKDWPSATASLNEAASRATAGSALANVIQAELTKVKKAAAGGGGL